MISIKSNKGITIVSLVITIIILLILTGVTISSIDLSNGTGRYNNMVADINLLEDKVFIYFNKYNEIPKTTRSIDINGRDYNEIDLSKLDNITLNYGEDYGKTEDLTNLDDVYLINSDLKIYYLKGVEVKGVSHHYLESDETSINKEPNVVSVEKNSSIELTKTYNGKAINYRIYGNSVQNGTPSPSNPVEIQSVGDKAENYYNIPVRITNAEGISTTFNIQLDEPLRKIGDYADYIDFETGKVVRYIKSRILTSNDNWTTYDYNSNGIVPFVITDIGTDVGLEAYAHSITSHYSLRQTCWATDQINVFSDHPNGKSYYFNTNFTTLSEWKEWLDDNELVLNYVLKTPVEEEINLPKLSIYEDYTKIEVVTDIIPSKIEVEYISNETE